MEESRKQVLVVDDEEMIERMTQTILECKEHKTVSFTDPRKALEYLRKNAKEVVLMVTDCKMPSLPGPDLIRQSLKVNPQLPVVVVSGHSDEYDVRDVRGAIKKLVTKPFTKQDILEAVKKTLKEIRH